VADLTFTIIAAFEQASAGLRTLAGDLDGIGTKLRELGGITATPTINLGNATQLRTEVDALKAKLDALSADRINPTIGATGLTETRTEIDALSAKLDELGRKKETPSAELQGEIAAKVAEINAELDKLGAKTVHPEVKVDTDTAVSNVRKLGTEADNLKTKFENLNLGGTWAAGISAAIIPLIQSIGQLSGALGLIPAIAAAAGTGLAAVVVGTQGMDAAFKAAEKSEKANEAAVKADAAAQKDAAAATTASTAAGTGNIAVLKQRVAEGAALVARLQAEKAAGMDVTTQLAAAKAAQAGYTADLKTATAAASGNTAAATANSAAQKQASSSASAAAAAHKAAAKAADEQAAAMNNLAPAAQGVVSAMLQLEPAFTALRMEVQQHLFEGLKQVLLDIANTALPVVQSGLTQMADAINTAVKDVGSFIQQQTSVSAWQSIFANIGQAASNLAGAVKPILQIITDITQVGSQFLPQLAQHFADAAAKAAEFVSKAKETGQLSQWIQTGITAVKELWDSLKNVVAIIADITAAPGFGPTFLQALKTVTDGIRWLIENVPALTTIVQAFVDAWLLAKVVQGISGIVTTITGSLTSAITGATTAVTALGTAWTFLEGGGLALKMNEIATATEAMTTKFTGSAAAGAAMESTMGKVGTVVAGLGGSLPILGAALVALTIEWQNHKSAVDTAAAAIMKGGQEATDAINKLKAADADASAHSFGNWIGALSAALGIAKPKLAEVTAEVDKMKAAMDPLTRAQSDLTAAQNNYLTSVQKFGTDSPQAVAAFKQMDDAAKNLTTQQGLLKTAQDATTKSMRDQTTQMGSALSAEVGFKSQLDTVTQAIKDNGTATDTNTAAGQKNVTNIIDLVNKAQSWETEAQKNGQSNQQLAQLHADLGVQIQAATGKLDGQNGSLNTLTQNYVKSNPLLQLKPTVDPSGVQTGMGAVNSAIDGVHKPAPVIFTADPSNLVAGVGQASTAIGSVPTPPITQFVGDPSQLVAGAGEASAAIAGVQQPIPFKFTADITDITAKTSTAQAQITGVQQPAPTKFTADITDVTTKTTDATTQITAAAVAPPAIKLTADITDVTKRSTDATTQVNAVKQTQPIQITANNSQALQAIQQVQQQLNALQNKTVTVTVQTVQAGAGGMIVSGMASGGIVPMASGFTSMSAASAAIVPPNSMRLIGDRPIGDEAFIPINNSGVSTAILSETARRMGKRVVPMASGGVSGSGDWMYWDEPNSQMPSGYETIYGPVSSMPPGSINLRSTLSGGTTGTSGGAGRGGVAGRGGGRSWDDDDDIWRWFGHGHGRGGGTPNGPPSANLFPGTSSVAGMVTSNVSAGPGSTASITQAGRTRAQTAPYGAADFANDMKLNAGTPTPAPGGGKPPPIHFTIGSGSASLDAFLCEILRRAVRAQGGDVQKALGA